MDKSPCWAIVFKYPNAIKITRKQLHLTGCSSLYDLLMFNLIFAHETRYLFNKRLPIPIPF